MLNKKYWSTGNKQPKTSMAGPLSLPDFDQVKQIDSSRTQIIAISGATGVSGKSTTSVNLATTIALGGKKSVILDFSFGSVSPLQYLGIDKPQVTLNDFLSGEINSLSSALTSTPYHHLQYIDSGMDFLDTHKKLTISSKKTIKALYDLNTDYIVVDLGLITDSVKLDFFVASDIPVLVARPGESPEISLIQIAKTMVLRKTSEAFSRTKEFINYIDYLLKQTDITDSSLLDKIAGHAEGDKRNAKKVDKLRESLSLHIITNMIQTRADMELGAQIKEELTARIGINVCNLGFIPEDEVIYEATIAHRPAPYFNVYAPVSESYRAIARNIAPLDDTAVDQNAIDTICERIDKFDSLKEVENEQELKWKIEQSKREIEAKLERDRSIRKQEIENELSEMRESRISALKEDMVNQLEPIRLEVEEELAESKREGMKRVYQDISDYENQRMKEIDEWTRVTKREELKGFRSRLYTLRDNKMAQIEAKYKTVEMDRVKALEQELSEKRKSDLKSLESLNRKRKIELEEEILQMAEHQRKEARARFTKEVEPIREDVWHELEEDRQKKIESIQEELRKYRAEKLEIVHSETAGLKKKIKERFEEEMKIRCNTLLEDAQWEVMRISSALDEENARHLADMRARLNRKYQIDREEFFNKLQDEMTQYRKLKTKEVITQVEIDRKERLEKLDKEIAQSQKLKIVKARGALMEMIEINKEKVKKGVEEYRGRVISQIEKERENLLAKADREIREIRSSKMESARDDAEKMYKRMVTAVHVRIKEIAKDRRATISRELDDYNNERKMSIQRALNDTRRQKAIELANYISGKRIELFGKLDDELNHRKEGWYESARSEVDKSKQKWLSDIETELKEYRKSGFAQIADELDVDKQSRLTALANNIKMQEHTMRENLDDLIGREEEKLRAHLVANIEADRKELHNEMIESIHPQQIQLENDLTKEMDMRRKEALKALDREIETVRQGQLETLEEWEKAKKKELFALVEANVRQIEVDRLKRMEEKLTAWHDMATNRVNKKLQRDKNAAQLMIRKKLDEKKAQQISKVKKEIQREIQYIREDTLHEIEIYRTNELKRVDAELKEKRIVLLAHLNEEIVSERESLTGDIFKNLENDKARKLLKIKSDLEQEETAMLLRLEDKADKMRRQKEEWLKYDLDKMKLDLKNRMYMELENEKSIKSKRIENELSAKSDRLMTRVEQEARYERQRQERIISDEVERDRDNIRQMAIERIEIEFQAKHRDMSEALEAQRKSLAKDIDKELEREKEFRLAEMESSIGREKQTRFDILKLEIKTEENSQRQELNERLMRKKEELEISFSREKEIYLTKLREEMKNNPFVDKKHFVKEIERITRNLRMMN